MKIIALDLAITTGFAFGDSIETAHAGTWKLPGYNERDLPRTLGGIYSSVLATCRANAIEVGIVETAMRGLKKKNQRGITTPTSAWGDRCLTMLNGAAMAGMANAGVRILKPVAPNTWRKSVLGIAYPDKPKDAAVEHCRRIGHKGLVHDAAEALCILQHALGEQDLLAKIKS